MDRGPWRATVHGVTKSQARLSSQHFHFMFTIQCIKCEIPGSGIAPLGGNGNPLQYSCQENSMDKGAWWPTVHEVAKSQIQVSF